MSQCNDCTRGEYAEEGVDDGGRAGKTATKNTKTSLAIQSCAMMHDILWSFTTWARRLRMLMRCYLTELVYIWDMVVGGCQFKSLVQWDQGCFRSHDSSIHPALQVLRFVRLVDVESSMIKKYRAVAKIVSQVLGMWDVEHRNPRKLALNLRCTMTK